jgi:K(+)-stimulated pyrophosphate-energized sodium pump
MSSHRRSGRVHAPQARRRMKTIVIAVVTLLFAVLLVAAPQLAHYSFAQDNSIFGGQPPGVPADPAIALAHGGGASHGEAIQLPFGPEAWGPLYVVLVSALIAIAFGTFWWKKTQAADPGSERMQGVAQAVREGALAYLAQQVKTMAPLVGIIGIGLFFLYKAQYAFMGDALSLKLGLGVAFAFVIGVIASYVAGYIGMGVAVIGNLRTAAAALKSFKSALEIAFQAGAVSGMFTVGLGLLGATITFMIFKENAMFVLVGFGFGGSLAALFMRVGGGIFTKAADVGADLVGKVEAGIPEDDPRNAATIADNVGDNVGDCAGMAADVFESYEVTLVAAIILAAAVGSTLAGTYYGPLIPLPGVESFTAMFTLKLIIYALLIRAVGVFASIIGVFAVRGKDDPNMNPMKPINVGFNVSTFIAFLGFWAVSLYVFYPVKEAVAKLGGNGEFDAVLGNFWLLAAVATTLGILLTQVIGKITEHFTATEHKPVTEVAASARTGPATLILAGLSEGMESSVWAILAIAGTLYGSYMLFHDAAMSAYAISLAGLGLLATTGYVLAMDTFGPISDNANGIFEMSGALKNADGTENKAAHHIVSHLDMVGNTTKALTKGFAIATAVIAAVALYRSFLDTVAGAQLTQGITEVNSAGVTQAAILVKNIQVNLPDVFIGLLIGGAIPFLFSSFAIRAVSRAAVTLIEEVRRQFKTIPGIMQYTGVGEVGKPDYARCVEIVTAAAQKELLGPGLLAVFAPIFVGFWLGAYALGGFLAGCILVGQLMAVFMSNAGGAWDNAKKKIEDGYMGWGKGSEAHKAGVVGDTVGDPLKDTAGPALNPMIKVMNLISILIAPSTVMYQGKPIGWVVMAVALIILAWSVMFSKRGGVDMSLPENKMIAGSGH